MSSPDLEQLEAMFPNISKDAIEAVYQSTGRNSQRAAEVLMTDKSMTSSSSSFAPPPSSSLLSLAPLPSLQAISSVADLPTPSHSLPPPDPSPSSPFSAPAPPEDLMIPGLFNGPLPLDFLRPPSYYREQQLAALCARDEELAKKLDRREYKRQLAKLERKRQKERIAERERIQKIKLDYSKMNPFREGEWVAHRGMVGLLQATNRVATAEEIEATLKGPKALKKLASKQKKEEKKRAKALKAGKPCESDRKSTKSPSSSTALI